jgi:hypothetical protein
MEDTETNNPRISTAAFLCDLRDLSGRKHRGSLLRQELSQWQDSGMSSWPASWFLRCFLFLGVWAGPLGSLLAQRPSSPPRLRLPEPKIVEVYRGNWFNTLGPCLDVPPAGPNPGPHLEPLRPWRVDGQGHYPGWYPGVDVKHSAAAYLACAKDLPLFPGPRLAVEEPAGPAPGGGVSRSVDG